METTTVRASVSWVAVVVAALLTSACTLEKQTQPSLIGPAELGLSIAMRAAPDQLPRDGTSQSVVTLTARDATSQPIGGQRLSLSLSSTSPSGAAISQSEVTTNSAGTATFSVTAPTEASVGDSITVFAVPVSSNADNARARSISILVTPTNTGAPTAAFVFSPAAPDMGQPVTFDASTTTDEGAACTSCGFTWNFGDGTTGTGRVVTHVFNAAGTYTVSLTAIDSVGTSSRSFTQAVTIAATTIPTNVTVTASPNPPIAKQAATFTATATAAANHRIVSYQFSWGDGDSVTIASPVWQHTYSQSGQYLITLTVRDDLNQSSTGYTVITVSSGLTAAFTTQIAGTTVTFDASTSSSQVASTITDYAWDFDTDGSYDANGSNPVVSHDYGSSGTYRATLRITDSRGVSATLTQTVVVP